MPQQSSEELREELAKLRRLIAQTQEMGLEILELEDRAAEIEAKLKEIEAGSQAATPSSAVDAIRLITPPGAKQAWHERPLALIGGAAGLPDHRAAIMDLCLTHGLFPVAIGQLPADPSNTIRGAVAVADSAALYIGVFGYQYGHIPGEAGMSVPEIIYNRTVQRQIPRLIFFMGRKHPVDPERIDRGEKAAKLSMFKAEMRKQEEVHTFDSIEDLHIQLDALLNEMAI